MRKAKRIASDYKFPDWDFEVFEGEIYDYESRPATTNMKGNMEYVVYDNNGNKHVYVGEHLFLYQYEPIIKEKKGSKNMAPIIEQEWKMNNTDTDLNEQELEKFKKLIREFLNEYIGGKKEVYYEEHYNTFNIFMKYLKDRDVGNNVKHDELLEAQAKANKAVEEYEERFFLLI